MELALLLTCPVGYLVITRGTYGLFKWRNMFVAKYCCDKHPAGEEATKKDRVFLAFFWPVMLLAFVLKVTGRSVLDFVTAGW